MEKKIYTEEEKLEFKRKELQKIELALAGIEIARDQLLNKIRWLRKELNIEYKK